MGFHPLLSLAGHLLLVLEEVAVAEGNLLPQFITAAVQVAHLAILLAVMLAQQAAQLQDPQERTALARNPDLAAVEGPLTAPQRKPGTAGRAALPGVAVVAVAEA